MAEELLTPELYELSEMMVDTVGIVGKGANNQMFFLLKSEDTPMEELTEPGPATDETFWAKVRGIAQEVVKAAMPKMTRRHTAEMPDDMEEEMDDEPVDEPADENAELDRVPDGKKGKRIMSKEQGDDVSKAVTDQLEAIQKANEARIEAIEKQYQAKLAEMTQQVETSKQEIAKAVEQRERMEWLEKARGFVTLPVSPTEVAERLHAIAKSAPEQIEWLEGLLRAADHELTQAGLFAEIGTTRVPDEATPEGKVEKSVKGGKNPVDALLSLSIQEQEALLKEMRGGK